MDIGGDTLNKFIGKLYKFMYGRYGIDELYKLGLVVCIVLSFINIFLDNRIISVIETLLIVIIVYRSMSRNIVKRRYENKKYLGFKKKIKNKFSLIKRKWYDRNTHIYKKCPKCKTVLRLPLKKGIHTCKCPTCHNKFEVKCRKDEKVKVEVIKGKS